MSDISEFTAFSNLHTHTVFSDGKHTVEQMTQAALDCGFCAVGFSDHSYTFCDESYCMMSDRFDDYLTEVRRIQKLFRGKIDVFAGLEWDYYTSPAQAHRELLDYTIGSVHYVEAKGVYYAVDHAADIQKNCVEQGFGGDYNAFAKKYFGMVAEHIIKNRSEIAGHFDVISKFSLKDEEDPAYQKIALEALDAVLSTGAVIEVNTGGMARGYKKRPYPKDFLLKYILEKKGRITMSADTHCMENTDFAFGESLTYLRELGFRTLAIMTPRGFEERPF